MLHGHDCMKEWEGRFGKVLIKEVYIITRYVSRTWVFIIVTTPRPIPFQGGKHSRIHLLTFTGYIFSLFDSQRCPFHGT